MGAVYYGAIIGAGFYLYYEDGVNVGRLLTAYLNGELDTATMAINAQSGQGHVVNLDSAHILGIELSDEVDGAS